MLEILIIGFVFFMGYQLGASIMAYRFRNILIRLAKTQGIILDASEINSKPAVYQLVVEEVQNTLYLYDKEKNTFVCQGNSIDDLASMAKEHKNIEYAAVLYNEKVYKFVDGKATQS
jgi:hypothetical protein